MGLQEVLMVSMVTGLTSSVTNGMERPTEPLLLSFRAWRVFSLHTHTHTNIIFLLGFIRVFTEYLQSIHRVFTHQQTFLA